jgi:hypothetical protein
MIREMFSAVALLALVAGPSEAQYRVKTRFPWVPQQGSAPSAAFGGQHRSMHFNPKEIRVDQSVPWQKARMPVRVHQPITFSGRGIDIARVDGQIGSQMNRGNPFRLGSGMPLASRHVAPIGLHRGMFRR